MQIELQTVQSDLGLHCLLRPICPKTYDHYGIFSTKCQNNLNLPIYRCHKQILLMFLFHYQNHFYRYQGYISAALVLGGVDVTGPHLYSIHPHGSTDKLPYVTMGKDSYKCFCFPLPNPVSPVWVGRSKIIFF